MTTRTARTAWKGTLPEGSGSNELVSSGLGTYDVSWPKRTSETADGTTSPEELIAAAHSSCFSMALSYEIAKAGGTPQSLEVSADVTLGQEDGAPTITKIALTVRGEVEGIDARGSSRPLRPPRPVARSAARSPGSTRSPSTPPWRADLAVRVDLHGRRRDPDLAAPHQDDGDRGDSGQRPRHTATLLRGWSVWARARVMAR